MIPLTYSSIIFCVAKIRLEIVKHSTFGCDEFWAVTFTACSLFLSQTRKGGLQLAHWVNQVQPHHLGGH